MFVYQNKLKNLSSFQPDIIMNRFEIFFANVRVLNLNLLSDLIGSKANKV